MRKKVIGFLLVFILVLSSLVFVIAQVPNPGHSWDQMVKDLNLTVDTFANRVGIGTTAPQQKLHVHNGSLGFTYSNFSHLKFSIGLDPNATGYEPFLWTQKGQGLRIEVGEAGEVMRITTNGRVGIGTTAPQQKLHVHRGSLGFTYSNFSNLEFSIGLDPNFTGYEPFLWTQIGQGLRIGVGEAGEVMRITTNGSVGIGTTAPQQKLHVHNGSLGFSYFNFSHLKFSIGLDPNATGYEPFLWTQEGQGLRIGVGAGEVMRITTNGSVGIGTTAPQQKLHVHNGSLGFSYFNFSHLKFSIGLDPNATGYEPFLWTQIGQGLRIGVGAGEVMRITPAGNVGIKTTNPQANLDVNGTIRIESLKGSANAYACINSNGTLYRSSTPCVWSS